MALFRILLCSCWWLLALVPASHATSEFDEALAALIQQAGKTGCSSRSNELETVLCNKKIRIGVRSNYFQFGFQAQAGSALEGFEIDLSKEIANRLGVEADLHVVSPANRIEKLIDGGLDIVLATMAHTTTRESIIDFVRPHYYSSPTSIYGPVTTKVSDWSDLRRKSVCVPLGSYSNIVFSDHQVRLMIYDRPDRMIDALRFGACHLIAHDQSLLRGVFVGQGNHRDASQVYEEKFYFNDVPWGIGVRKSARENLGKAIALIIADLHLSGKLLEMAKAHHISTTFLQAQHEKWKSTVCFDKGKGAFLDACLIQPSSLVDQPSLIAEPFSRFESWINSNFDLSVRFPMLTGQNALKMFLNGIVVSFVLVFGAILATLVISFGFFRLETSRYWVVRLPFVTLRTFFQNSPIILLLSLGYLSVAFVTEYSTTIAVMTAMVVIGLNNGATGASALKDASGTLAQPYRASDLINVASVQLRACAINAAKASPVAAFVGAPEMLSVLTDITSFTGERLTTYTILSVFYLLVVQLVVVLTEILMKRLEKNARVSA